MNLCCIETFCFAVLFTIGFIVLGSAVVDYVLSRRKNND